MPIAATLFFAPPIMPYVIFLLQQFTPRYYCFLTILISRQANTAPCRLFAIFGGYMLFRFMLAVAFAAMRYRFAFFFRLMSAATLSPPCRFHHCHATLRFYHSFAAERHYVDIYTPPYYVVNKTIRCLSCFIVVVCHMLSLRLRAAISLPPYAADA